VKPPSAASSTRKMISFMLCSRNASSHCRTFRDSEFFGKSQRSYAAEVIS
jgi:hypothetical protein